MRSALPKPNNRRRSKSRTDATLSAPHLSVEASIATELIGWISAAVLLSTIISQVYKQWADGRTEGVSKWLFVGQIAASAGFTLYSYLIGNWVFVATNALILASAAVGEILVLRNKRRSIPRPNR